VSDEAATPTGGAETSARPDVSATTEKPSVHDRLKSSLFGSPEPGKPKPQVARAETESKAEPTEAEPEQEEQPVEAQDEPEDDAQPEETEAEPETLEELAERLGWDLDKVLSLKTKTKIDGKEGTQLLRDLVKSYQLEGHLNQKLMTHAEERKAFETERHNFFQTSQHKLQQLDTGVKIAQKLLEGDFSQVNWQELQDQDPVAFAQRFAGFQQRKAQIDHVANLLAQEHQQSQQQAAAQTQAYLAEQMRLLESKVPEWSSDAGRTKSLGEMAPVFTSAYGISAEELGNVSDHRMLLVARDAWQWQKLQKAKPAIVNKVKSAPKLLKPGAPQSRAAQEGLLLKQERDRLRKSGKVSDAKAPLKRLLFS